MPTPSGAWFFSFAIWIDRLRNSKTQELRSWTTIIINLCFSLLYETTWFSTESTNLKNKSIEFINPNTLGLEKCNEDLLNIFSLYTSKPFIGGKFIEWIHWKLFLLIFMKSFEKQALIRLVKVHWPRWKRYGLYQKEEL